MDASKHGMGGIWYPTLLVTATAGPQGKLAPTPFAWRAPFPRDLQHCLVLSDNPTSDITTSNLELTGILIHAITLA